MRQQAWMTRSHARLLSTVTIIVCLLVISIVVVSIYIVTIHLLQQ